MRPFLLLGALSLALPMTSCSLALRVQRTTTEETVREPLGSSISVKAERRQDDLHVAVRRAERVRVSTFDVETVERRRTQWAGTPPGNTADTTTVIVMCDVLLVLPLLDLGLGVAAPFRANADVALGPIGVLLAFLVPGITLVAGDLQGEIWDVSVDRRARDTREVTEHQTGIVTNLRVVTDREVFEVTTDAQGLATIPLDRLFGPTRAPGRVTLAHGDDLLAVRFDGTTITTNRLQAEATGR